MELEGEATRRYYIGDHYSLQDTPNINILPTYASGNYLDWDAVEQVLSNVYTAQLKINAQVQIGIQELPLLMTEASIVHSDQRQKMCELAFEKLQVQNYFTCKQAVLSCFSLGRSSGLVLDSGASCTEVVPVHDGYALQKNSSKVDIGGNHVDEFLLKYLQNDLGHKFDQNGVVQTQNTLEHIRGIKEELYKQENNDMYSFNSREQYNYELPDGKVLNMGNERLKIYDYLLGQTQENFKGYHHMIMEQVNGCDIDLRKEFYQNVILCGGNSLLGGLTDKIQKNLNENIPQGLKAKVLAYPSANERRYSSWMGGSILSCLGTFQNMWVSKQEYEEHGSYIVNKKCP